NGLIGVGMLQSANGGDAHVSLDNDGTIDLNISGRATATVDGSSWDALAGASLTTGIEQQAQGARAAAAFANGPDALISVDISATAKAVNDGGTGGDAIARANITDDVTHQQVHGFRGAASATLANYGTIELDLVAGATA